jgi:protein involved in polysaccharide export with SLBB domain
MIRNSKKILILLLIFCFSVVHCASSFGQLLLNKPFTVQDEDIEITGEKIRGLQGSNSKSQGKAVSPLSEYILDTKALKEYRLGPGDIIEIHIIVGDSALTADYNFAISPSGTIFFPNIGEINLDSLALDDAKRKLIRKIGEKYQQKFFLSLILQRPKKIRVYVTGQVKNKGAVITWDGNFVSEVVKLAGGIAPGGSNRTVYIKRYNKKLGRWKILEADLYLAGGKGNLEKDIRVHNEDIVEIPVVKSIRVTLLGEVPSPGQYELKVGERLKDLLMMGGYLGVNSALSDVVFLKREVAKDTFKEYKLNLHNMVQNEDKNQNVILADGDIVTIPSIKAFIYVYGEVKNSGRLDYLPGSRLSDYLNLAGGPTERASLAYVSVTRQEGNKPKVYRVNAADVLHKGIAKNDIELMAGDVVNVPTNFFYFSDFASFASVVFTAVALYSTFVK